VIKSWRMVKKQNDGIGKIGRNEVHLSAVSRLDSFDLFQMVAAQFLLLLLLCVTRRLLQNGHFACFHKSVWRERMERDKVLPRV
jgi:hypothetical protein